MTAIVPTLPPISDCVCIVLDDDEECLASCVRCAAYREAREVLDRILLEYTYKPGWRIQAPVRRCHGVCDLLEIALTCTQPIDPVTHDRAVFDDGGPMALWFGGGVTPGASRALLEREIGYLIMSAEHHEAREFFRRNGEPVFAAHNDSGVALTAPFPTEVSDAC